MQVSYNVHILQLVSLKAWLKYTVKTVLSGQSNIDNTKVLKTDGSLMQVKSITECSLGAFCNTFDLH